MREDGHLTPQHEVHRNGRNPFAYASVEIYPASTILPDTIGAFEGTGRRITVTSSPHHPIESTLELARSLQERGLDVSPHIAAHQVRDEDHLREISEYVADNRFRRAFLVKGDGPLTGEYKTSAQLMRGMVDMGVKLEEAEIAGYPEGHPDISQDSLEKGIQDREKLATEMGAVIRIITQMCFSATAIHDYAEWLESKGIKAELTVGLPAPEPREALLKKAVRCGVGDSRNELLEGTGDYDPTQLVEELTRLDTGRGRISGYHFYSFNNVRTLRAFLG